MSQKPRSNVDRLQTRVQQRWAKFPSGGGDKSEEKEINTRAELHTLGWNLCSVGIEPRAQQMLFYLILMVLSHLTNKERETEKIGTTRNYSANERQEAHSSEGHED